MLKILLLLVFMYDGQLQVEKKAFNSVAECEKAGQKRVAEQMLDPKFDQGLFGACIQSRELEV